MAIRDQRVSVRLVRLHLSDRRDGLVGPYRCSPRPALNSVIWRWCPGGDASTPVPAWRMSLTAPWHAHLAALPRPDPGAVVDAIPDAPSVRLFRHECRLDIDALWRDDAWLVAAIAWRSPRQQVVAPRPKAFARWRDRPERSGRSSFDRNVLPSAGDHGAWKLPAPSSTNLSYLVNAAGTTKFLRVLRARSNRLNFVPSPSSVDLDISGRTTLIGGSQPQPDALRLRDPPMKHSNRTDSGEQRETGGRCCRRVPW